MYEGSVKILLFKKPNIQLRNTHNHIVHIWMYNIHNRRMKKDLSGFLIIHMQTTQQQ